MRIRAAVTAATVAAFAIGTGNAAFAACTKLAFSVNDYGKDGPTKDALSLLDKYAAKWTAERGIKKYSLGKKDVSCELFLNFIVFDEHTCTASATVCWDGPGVAGTAAQEPTPIVNKAAGAAPAGRAAAPTAAPAGRAAAPAAPAAPGTSPVTTGTVRAVAPVVPAPKSPPAAVAPTSAPAAVMAPAPAPVQAPAAPGPAAVPAPGGN